MIFFENIFIFYLTFPGKVVQYKWSQINDNLKRRDEMYRTEALMKVHSAIIESMKASKLGDFVCIEIEVQASAKELVDHLSRDIHIDYEYHGYEEGFEVYDVWACLCQDFQCPGWSIRIKANPIELSYYEGSIYWTGPKEILEYRINNGEFPEFYYRERSYYDEAWQNPWQRVDLSPEDVHFVEYERINETWRAVFHLSSMVKS